MYIPLLIYLFLVWWHSHCFYCKKLKKKTPLFRVNWIGRVLIRGIRGLHLCLKDLRREGLRDSSWLSGNLEVQGSLSQWSQPRTLVNWAVFSRMTRSPDKTLLLFPSNVPLLDYCHFGKPKSSLSFWTF